MASKVDPLTSICARCLNSCDLDVNTCENILKLLILKCFEESQTNYQNMNRSIANWIGGQVWYLRKMFRGPTLTAMTIFILKVNNLLNKFFGEGWPRTNVKRQRGINDVLVRAIFCICVCAFSAPLLLPRVLGLPNHSLAILLLLLLLVLLIVAVIILPLFLAKAYSQHSVACWLSFLRLLCIISIPIIPQ